ncbi:hypothetical protein FHR32_003979 [Streptosporangium album]|uniref:Integral membrane protein n=1 Tax=Streptosporangium album TaxID=47479 RepID=A0A7W7WB03_9ACTN|nr:hypothetical protein [Streptosporangium album]MBB4939674.1 hypothetical protein [Streptosporangium album]
MTDKVTAMTGNTATDPHRLLRLALRLDSVVTTVNGLAYLALAGPINDLLGLPVTLQYGIGVFLTVYGVAIWLAARPAAINRTAALAAVVLNTLWTVVSVGELAIGGLEVTALGTVWVLLQAVTVGGFAALQYLGLRASR